MSHLDNTIKLLGTVKKDSENDYRGLSGWFVTITFLLCSGENSEAETISTDCNEEFTQLQI